MGPQQSSETPDTMPPEAEQQVSGVQPTPNQLMLPIGGLQIHQGPIPRAEDLQAYENVLRGSADRIIKMAEREQKGAIRLRWADWFSQFVSMFMGKGFLYFLFGGSIYLAMNGKDAAAVVTAIAPVASIVYSTLFGDKKKDGK